MIDLAAVTSLRAVPCTARSSSAAAALGFTPSAVSQQVKRLEKQTGLPLLERVGRGVVLTAHGRHLVEAGGRLLAEVEAVESGLHRAPTRSPDASGSRRSPPPFGAWSRRPSATLREAHPDLTLALTEYEPWDTIDLVASGQTDLGVVHRWGDLPIGIPEHLEAVTSRTTSPTSCSPPITHSPDSTGSARTT